MKIKILITIEDESGCIVSQDEIETNKPVLYICENPDPMCLTELDTGYIGGNANEEN